MTLKYYLFTLIIIIGWACQPEEEIITYSSNSKLRFSSDTIFFDTIFTSIGSVTKRFRVYNDDKNAIIIDKVSLASTSSPYSIFVNGFGGPSVENIRVLGGDSVLILAQVTIDPKDQNLPFIVEDKINFLTNGNLQEVQLVSWGQDAYFLRDSVLACNTTWTNDRPYVLYNSVLVEEGCQLTINPGTKIYSHNGSFFLVGGQLIAKGTSNERITFTNDRFDEDFINAPGQWGGIIFLRNSHDNEIGYADIRNANIGIYLGSPDSDTIPDLVLTNTRIENIGGNELIASVDSLVQPGYGILAINSDLKATNVLVDNCEINLLANLAGGNYTYEHCTFGNYSKDFFIGNPALVLANNLILDSQTLLVSDLQLQLTNCIVWGSQFEEILLSEAPQAGFNLSVNNNILKTENPALMTNNFVTDPKWLNPFGYQYGLDTLSPAIDKGLPINVTVDLEGVQRDQNPDIGAFERQ